MSSVTTSELRSRRHIFICTVLGAVIAALVVILVVVLWKVRRKMKRPTTPPNERGENYTSFNFVRPLV